MLVTITGGTGFLGSHAVAAIARAGHEIRLLVRDRSRIATALAPLGIDPQSVDVIVGDVCDEALVGQAVKGVDAVIHAAGVYSFDGRDSRPILAVNVRAAQVVHESCRRAGVPRTVHVSSVAAMCEMGSSPFTVDSPVSRSKVPYMAAMAKTDLVARSYQEAGDPVVIAYPPATLGPNDPHLGDQSVRVRNTLQNRIPIWPTGGISITDVRDVADLLAAAIEPHFTATRCVPPATFMPTRSYIQTLRDVTGRRLPATYAPAKALLPIARTVSWVQQIVPWHIPYEYGAVYACASQPRFVASAFTVLPSARPRPIAQTMADTVRWLYEQGHLTRRQAGWAVQEAQLFEMTRRFLPDSRIPAAPGVH